jgi:hypothetical protein
MHELLDGKNLSVLGVIVNKYGKEMGGRYGYYHYRYGKYRYGYYTASKKNKNDTGTGKTA